MATTFTTATAWQLEAFTPEKEHGGKSPPGAYQTAAEDYEFVRDRFTLILFREGQGLTAISSKVGEVKDGADLTFVNGNDTLTGASGYNFRCIENPIVPISPGTGMWRETLIMVYTGEWELQNVHSGTS